MTEEKQFDEYKILDTVNQWIFNCDTKVSIMLATLGIFITILFSSDVGVFMARTIKASLSNITVCNLIYLFFLIIGMCLLVIGICKFIKVLIPTINLDHPSVMFFGSVASFQTFDIYREAVNSCTSDKLDDDLMHQIYAASLICNQKFKNYKQGIMLSFLGIGIILFWMLLGFLVYYI